MPESAQNVRGSVVGLWRYPVKSMMGEELNATEVAERGLRGDRAYAIVDSLDGKVATAKNPRKWPNLFDFRAALSDAPKAGVPIPPVRITLPDGTIVSSNAANVHQSLSAALGRPVTLLAAEAVPVAASSSPRAIHAGTSEEYWPDMEGLDFRDTVTDFTLPEGTFFDSAVVHVLTTATLNQLRALYSQGRFETRRFRPNIVIEAADTAAAFVENDWVGHTLAIGEAVRLTITGPCPRCVMTTLPQGDLPRDSGILRTAAQHNKAAVGVYASVSKGGKIRRGDRVSVE
jgi:MOSC domain-containing protein